MQKLKLCECVCTLDIGEERIRKLEEISEENIQNEQRALRIAEDIENIVKRI